MSSSSSPPPSQSQSQWPAGIALPGQAPAHLRPRSSLALGGLEMRGALIRTLLHPLSLYRDPDPLLGVLHPQTAPAKPNDASPSVHAPTWYPGKAWDVLWQQCLDGLSARILTRMGQQWARWIPALADLDPDTIPPSLQGAWGWPATDPTDGASPMQPPEAAPIPTEAHQDDGWQSHIQRLNAALHRHHRQFGRMLYNPMSQICLHGLGGYALVGDHQEGHIVSTAPFPCAWDLGVLQTALTPSCDPSQNAAVTISLRSHKPCRAKGDAACLYSYGA